jgi:hypothetical protein
LVQVTGIHSEVTDIRLWVHEIQMIRVLCRVKMFKLGILGLRV